MEAPIKQNHLNLAIAITLIFLAVLLRLMPHPDNFAPIAAIAIFVGAIMPSRASVLIPLFAMVASDLVIGLHSLILVTWGTYILIAAASRFWLKKRSLIRGMLLTIGASIFFFLTTNFAVWLEGRLYPRTLAGLQHCFVLALPFFRNTFVSDLLYTAVLFGLYYFALQSSHHYLKYARPHEY